jgi:ribosomal protein S27AE
MRPKMICPNCGIEMNQHAEKVDYTNTSRSDPVFGGVVVEAHTCPGCGRTEVREEE